MAEKIVEKASAPKPTHYHLEEEGDFVLTERRYIDGQIFEGSPGNPIVLRLPKGYKVDKHLVPREKYTQQSLKPHFAVKAPPAPNLLATAQTVAISEVQVDPVTKTVIETKASAPSDLGPAVKVGRASDKSV